MMCAWRAAGIGRGMRARDVLLDIGSLPYRVQLANRVALIGLWPMMRHKAGRYPGATRPCGASGTRYATLRGRTGSRSPYVGVCVNGLRGR
eukprot:1137719-Prymnesium_polylepis.1